MPYDDDITPAQAIRKTWGWVPFGLNAAAASLIIFGALAGGITLVVYLLIPAGNAVEQKNIQNGYSDTVNSQASSGTFVLCDTASGEQKLDYWEGPVETETGTAVWDASTGTIQDVGKSMLPVCTVVSAHSGDGTNLNPGTKYYQCVKATGDNTKGTKLSRADFTTAS